MKLGISSEGLHDFIFFPHKSFHFTKNTGSEYKANSKLGLNLYEH
jgi:hypothetical protein